MSELPISYYEGVFRIFGYCSAHMGEQSVSFTVVEQHFLQGLKLAQETRLQCERAFRDGAGASEREVRQTAEVLGRQFRNRLHVLARVLLVCLELAVQDKRLSTRSDYLLRDLAEAFSIRRSSYEQLRSHFVRGELSTEVKQSPNEREVGRDAFQILGCAEGASATEIRRCYRQLALQFHPDVYQSLELPQTVRNSIRERFNEIQHAYEYLKEKKGIR